MKHLSFISYPLISRRSFGDGEFGALEVKYLFVELKIRDRSNAQGIEVAQHNFVLVINDPLDAFQQLNHRSGRYRYEAVPM